jgi:hypothetical protein
VRFRRCGSCEAIAIFRRVARREVPEELACAKHVEGEGWSRICAVEGCEHPPAFKVDYRVSEKRAHLTTCPEHFQILPDDMSEVFRV